MQRATWPCAFAMALLLTLAPTPSEGFTLAPVSGSGLLGRGLRAFPAVAHSSAQRAELAATGRERGRRPAQRAAGGLAMAAGESSTTKNLIVGFLAFGFLFGALFPLINNGLRIGTAGQEMSGAATGMRQKELDERLSKVHATLSRNSAASCCRPCRVRTEPVPNATPRAPVTLRCSRARNGRRRCSPPHRCRRLPSPTTRASPTSLRLTVRTRAFSSWYKKNTFNFYIS